jgi:hypothetical protein
VTGIAVTANATGYTVTNNTAYDLSVPVALQFDETDGAADYSFVDNCSGTSAHAYILVNGEAGMLRGQSIAVPASFSPSSVNSNPQPVVLTPLSDAVPNSLNFVTAFATPSQVAIAPADQSITIHGAAKQPYTAAPSYLTSTTGWMTVSPQSGNFDQFGFAILTVHFVGSQLQTTQEGHVNANVLVTTTSTCMDTVTGGQNCVTVSVPVEITFKAPVTVTLTASSPNSFSPASGNAEFTASLGYTPQIQGDGSTQITGAVSLRTRTIDPASGLVTGSTVLSTGYVNSGADCNAESPANDTVVFGGTGNTADYCPSDVGTSTSSQPPFVFNLAPGLYRLAAYYEGSGQGDSAYAPAVSLTMAYRVGDPLTGIAIASGNSQTAPASSYFNQLLAIQAYASSSVYGGPINVPVTFTVLPGSNGAAGTFNNGSTSVTVVTGSNGLAVAPPVVANSIQGAWGIVAGAPGLVTATFNLTNTPPSVPPSVTTTVTAKTGTPNARNWTFQFKDSGGIAAGNVTLNSLTIAPAAGAACTPVIKSGVPATIPLLAANTTGALTVTIDFSSCSPGTRFSVTPSVTASGHAMPAVVIGNQFQ